MADLRDIVVLTIVDEEDCGSLLRRVHLYDPAPVPTVVLVRQDSANLARVPVLVVSFHHRSSVVTVQDLQSPKCVDKRRNRAGDFRVSNNKMRSSKDLILTSAM